MLSHNVLENYRLQCLAVRMLEQAALDLASQARSPAEAGLSKQERYIRNQAAANRREAERWLSDDDEARRGFNFRLCSAVIGDHLRLDHVPTEEIASHLRKAVMRAPAEMALILSNLRRNMMNEASPTAEPAPRASP
ncbi:hypothetical protein [Chromobacterium sp. CV08]|uniref:hypothetical protein n=1 Tax=Chromobacterium sp. CV08 TaxID=3133274 RepID=UPI003DA80830